MLSPKAQQLIHDYFNLPFANVNNVRCPYFINSKKIVRGQLRALAGKGTPKEIVEEAKIMSIQYGYDIFDKHGLCHLPKDQKAAEVRKYLIDNDLGIDCSAFVVHILREHIKETKGFDFLDDIQIVSPKRFLRWIISKLRPIENIGVKVLIKDINTKKITNLKNIEPGDLIIMLQTGKNNQRDHILLVTDIRDNNIEYVHARAWSSEGKYGHGVSIGKIKIVKDQELLNQKWEELEKVGENNETYLEAKSAEILEIRRLLLP